MTARRSSPGRDRHRIASCRQRAQGSDQRPRRHLVTDLHAAERPGDRLSDHAQRRAAGDGDRERRHRGDRARLQRDDRRDGPEPHATVVANARPTVYVLLSCGGPPCTTDAGIAPTPDAGTITTSPRCGNGRVDPGETCDIAIAPGDPGACPPSNCDDGVACTTDTAVGQRLHRHLHAPAGYQHRPHRRVLSVGRPRSRPTPTARRPAATAPSRPGETCDTGIAAGPPGACPTSGECTSADPCTRHRCCPGRDLPGNLPALPGGRPARRRRLLSAGRAPTPTTPTARQLRRRRLGSRAKSATSGSHRRRPEAVPPSCDDRTPALARTSFLTGTGCHGGLLHAAITTPISGDGCCPPGATHATDTDCPAPVATASSIRARSCDSAATGPGACPTRAAPPRPSACVQTSPDREQAAACTAACVSNADREPAAPPATAAVPPAARRPPIPTARRPAATAWCSRTRPATSRSPAGSAGACPTALRRPQSLHHRSAALGRDLRGRLRSPPGDGVRRRRRLLPAGRRPQRWTPTAPPSAATASSSAGRDLRQRDPLLAVRPACPAGDACTTLTLHGSPTTCTASCARARRSRPAWAATAAARRAAPPSPTPTASPICGDGVVEAGEPCDRAITAGMPGACQRTCDDADACTTDMRERLDRELHARSAPTSPVVACSNDDGCCPAGCTRGHRLDCAPLCGDGHVGAGETCDPPSTCPTTCPDDGDPCTTEPLVGNPLTCNAACRHVPITTCSTAASDHCCPTGCTSATDSDC